MLALFHLLFDNSVVRGGFWSISFPQGKTGGVGIFFVLGIVLGSPDGTVGPGICLINDAFILNQFSVG